MTRGSCTTLTALIVAVLVVGCGPSPMELVARGNNLMGRGDFDGAITAYRKALEKSPDLAIAHNNLGWALQGKGDIEGARKAYEAAIAATGRRDARRSFRVCLASLIQSEARCCAL